ncbi:MAG: Bacterial alpha-L-rhamnosidase [Anaerolineaceae bacterium]|nr:Bacterial alpha-L-rhamnosidase [Anaerolineaceae bacterium]
MTTITNLKTEYLENPLGIDVTSPRLSWQLQSDAAGARQTAYQIKAGSSEGQADLWDSGKVDSDQSIHVVYAGKALASRQRVYWSVTVWDEAGSSTQSEKTWFEIGLLARDDWKGEWIGTDLRGGPRSLIPAPMFRKSIQLASAPQSARLYVTALGLYECSINGKQVSDDVFNPGWTDYSKRVQYKVYDVLDLLQEGENVIGAMLGDGWAVGHISWNHRQSYVDRPRLLAQLEITLKDGKTVTVATDTTWKYQFGPILSNDLLMGEEYDARLEVPGWDAPQFDDETWYTAKRFDDTGIEIVATDGPTVKRIQELKPISPPVDKSNFNSHRQIFDLGQNMVGRVRFKGSAPANTTITLRFAEVLDEDGRMYLTNLRSARAVDYYTFKSDEPVVWEPHFTFHGFRYVELVDYPGEVTEDTITGVVLHSEMAQTGEFECSDPILNQLQHNIQWGQKGNFVDVPTDCPQRDERLGWTGDIQVFVRTAAYNFDVAGFMTKWAQDVTDAQNEQGIVPPVVPNMKTSFLADGGPAWADAAVICPWTIYLTYGDKRILETSYLTMTKFMNFLLESSPGYIRCAPEYEGWPGFGDWLSINAATPRDLLGTAFLAYDASLMTQIAEVLGKQDDAGKYRKLFADVKEAFAKRYLIGSIVPAVKPMPSEARRRMDEADAISQGNLKLVQNETVTSKVFNTEVFTPTQTAYVLALHFNLLPDELRPLAVEELVKAIEGRNMHLSTGFVGAPYLPHVLSKNGRLDMAYTLLNQKTWPSWLYSVTQGATTIWERWDGWTEDRGFQDPGMNSFNHYAYGSIGAWMYNTIAGIEIDPKQPGYKHSLLQPKPDGSLSSACGQLQTPYGELVSKWKLENGIFDWEVTVPANTTATLTIPMADQGKMTMNGAPVSGAVQEVGAGKYHVVVA